MKKTMTKKNLKLVVFDFEGTVVDTLTGATKSFLSMLDFYELEKISVKKIHDYLSAPAMDMVRELLYHPDYPSDFYHRATFKYESIYRQNMIDHTKLYRGFKKILKDLSLRKNLSVCLISNQNYELVSENIDALEVTDFFDFIVAADQVENPKPHTEMIEQLMLATGATSDQVMFIGDEKSDIEMGKLAGVYTTAVTWGYGLEADLRLANPDSILTKPIDLTNIFA